MPPRLRRTPWWPFALLLLVAVGGGWVNTESARATVVSDATGEVVAPPTLRDVYFGDRHYGVGADGVYTAPNLPRGAKITIIAQGYGKFDANASDTEVRLTTAIISTQVSDAVSGKGVANPKARLGDAQVGSGTVDGSMVIAPAPQKGTAILICAKGYAPQTIIAGGPSVTVALQPQAGTDCAPLPTPVGQTPSPAPTPSGSPVASPTPSATPTKAP